MHFRLLARGRRNSRSRRRPPASAPVKRQVRATGTVEAAHVYAVQVPQITQTTSGKMTLTRLTANGIREPGQYPCGIRPYSTTRQRPGCGSQVRRPWSSGRAEKSRVREQCRETPLRSTASRSRSGQSQLQLRRGLLLSEIDRLKNEAKAADAQAHVETLTRSDHFHDVAEAANIRANCSATARELCSIAPGPTPTAW
jgi:hypothetical protein